MQISAQWYRDQADACERLAEAFRFLEGRNDQLAGVLLDRAQWLRSAARKSHARELAEMLKGKGGE